MNLRSSPELLAAGLAAVLLITAMAGCAPQAEPMAPAPIASPAPTPSTGPAEATGAAPATAPASANGVAVDLPGQQKWICTMCPEVISDKPGVCPKCGMNLVPKK